jgi:monoamine oxidase
MGNERPLGVIGGAHRIVDELHARFVSLGGVVQTGAVVSSINDRSVSRGDTAEFTVATEEGLVEVTTSKGNFLGNHMIFAAPPTAMKSIQFNPPLPAEKELLGRGSVMGSCIKAFAVYKEPFWRKKLQSGEAYVATGNSPLDAISYTFDASDPIQYPGLFILGVAITGARAQYWSQRSLPERQAAVLNSLKEFFGPQAAQPLYYLDCDWGLNPYTLGGPFAVLPPKVLQATFGILRLPIHRIHWAGAESSTQWYGTMEGAVDAGMVAAFEVNARVNAFKLLKQTLAQQHLAQTTGAPPVSAIPVMVGPQTGADPEKKAALAPPSPLNLPKNAGTTGSAPTPSPSTMKTRAR